jgi:hypothetical protein
VLNWDIRDLKSRVSKIEKDRHGLDKEQLDTIRTYGERSREEHQRLRNKSGELNIPRKRRQGDLLSIVEIESRSIVSVILSEASETSGLPEARQKLALEYLAIQLAIRDREQITKVLCHTQPDHLTEAVRNVVTAYEPVIRSVHNAVDLSETVSDFEHFLKDMLHISRLHHKDEKNKSHNEVVVPTVGDYIQLLKKHQSSCHKFLHQCAKNGKEVTGWFHDWARNAADVFRCRSDAPKAASTVDGYSLGNGGGSFALELNSIFTALPEDERKISLRILDAHAKYLSSLHAASAVRLASVVNSPVSNSPTLRHKPHQHLFQSLSHSSSRPSSTPNSRSTSPTREGSDCPTFESDPGPGAFLARWQELLDDTPITPVAARGPVRYGRSKNVQENSKVDVDGERKGDLEATLRNSSGNIVKQMKTGDQGLSEDEKVERPDVRPVVNALLPAFRQLLAKRSCNW